MNQRAETKEFILRILLACEDTPCPADILFREVRKGFVRPPTDADTSAALRDLEGDGYMAGVTDELSKRITWTLTDKGTHAARKIK